MRKLKLMIPLAFGLLFLSGCGDEIPVVEEYDILEAGEWTDGIYTAQAEGKAGNFDVTVVIDSGYITMISVGDNEETEELGGQAIELLPDEIIEAQTYEVDAVSGATITSNGIMNAVGQCLEEASE